jgi:hypothetical protein
MELVLITLAAFFSVMLLGLNSQYVRDQRIALVFCISWMIHTAQFLYVRIVAMTDNVYWAFFVSGWGSSLGIVSSILVYKYFQGRKKKNDSNSKE